MAYKRYARKQITRVKQTMRKRYTKKKGGALKMGKIAADVMKLQALVNVEKKYHQLTTISSNVGQVLINATGAIISDVTPNPPQGTRNNEITGNSFKLTGAYIEVQLKQQATLNTEAFYIFELWDVRGTPETTATIFTDLFNTSTFSGIVDAYSTRNQEHFADYRCMKRWIMKFKQDASADAVTPCNQVMTKMIPLKMDKHIRLNSSQVIQNGQIVLTVRANYGNSGTTDSTLSNLGTQTAKTGAELKYTTKYWFVDN